VAFDDQHWGDSDGRPRGWFSLARQQSDWGAAVAFARQGPPRAFSPEHQPVVAADASDFRHIHLAT